jgi:hypothetical protein
MSGAAGATATPDAASGRRNGKHLAQVPLAEDQHPVGDLGPDREH